MCTWGIHVNRLLFPLLWLIFYYRDRSQEFRWVGRKLFFLSYTNDTLSISRQNMASHLGPQSFPRLILVLISTTFSQYLFLFSIQDPCLASLCLIRTGVLPCLLQFSSSGFRLCPTLSPLAETLSVDIRFCINLNIFWDILLLGSTHLSSSKFSSCATACQTLSKQLPEPLFYWLFACHAFKYCEFFFFLN